MKFFPLILFLAWGADRQFCNTNNIVRISTTSPNMTETCGSSCPVGTGLEFYWKCGVELDYDWRAISLVCFSGCFYPRGQDLNTFNSAFAQCLAKYEADGLLPESDNGKSMGHWLCSSECYLKSKAFGGDCDTCISNNPPAYDSISGNKCWWCQDTEWCTSSDESDCWGETRGWGDSICKERVSFIMIYGWVIGGSMVASLIVVFILWFTTETHIIIDHEKDAKAAIIKELYDGSGHAVFDTAEPAYRFNLNERGRARTVDSLPTVSSQQLLQNQMGKRVVSHDTGRLQSDSGSEGGETTGLHQGRQSWTDSTREKAVSVALEENKRKEL